MPLPLAAMPGGARVGSLVHAVLERVDFTAADLDGELADSLAEQLGWRHVDVGPPDVVVAGLRAAIETPLGPLVGDRRLRDVGPADRLDELGFELPLVGGDDADGGADARRRSPACSTPTSGPTTRWPATPTGSAIPLSASSCAAT